MDQTIADLVEHSHDFDILEKAITAAELGEALDDPNANLTVFAPTDDAFVHLAQGLGYQGDPHDEHAVFQAIAEALAGLSPDDDPIPLLTDVLLYHGSAGAKTAHEIAALDTVETLLEGATIHPDGRTLIDNEPDVRDPNITVPDVQASNGIVQVIDGVLIPVDIPGNEQLATLTGDDALI